MKSRLFAVPFFGAVCVAALVALANPAAAAADPEIHVIALDGSQGWAVYDQRGSGVNAIDPHTDSTGDPGALALNTPLSADKASVFAPLAAPASLLTLTTLSYQTFRTAPANSIVLPSVQFIGFCNVAAKTGFISFVYEPYYSQQAGIEPQVTVNDSWQTWNAYSGGHALWWTSRGISATPGGGVSTSQISDHNTWAYGGQIAPTQNYTDVATEFMSACPAGGVTAVELNQGSGNPGVAGFVDQLDYHIGGTGQLVNFAIAVTRPSSASAPPTVATSPTTSVPTPTSAGPSTTPVVVSEPASGLANTGTKAAWLALVGGALLIAGMGVLRIGRRSREH